MASVDGAVQPIWVSSKLIIANEFVDTVKLRRVSFKC